MYSSRVPAAAACLALVACHRAPSPEPPSCREALVRIAAFYTAVAAEQDASPLHAGLSPAESALGISEAPLVTVQAAPTDVSASDYLLVGPTGAAIVTANGDMRPLLSLDDRGLFVSDKAASLVIAISPNTPWSTVQALYQLLRMDPSDRIGLYRTIGLAYHVDGAFAGRTPPSIPGATKESVDLPRTGDAVALEAAAHCPALAAAMARLPEVARVSDGLRAMAASISSCDCASNLGTLEAVPWLFRRPITAVVPIELASKTPAFPTADSKATFGDVVRANGARPIAFAVPPLPPPPPRPHP
jgi:hypothetical protein